MYTFEEFEKTRNENLASNTKVLQIRKEHNDSPQKKQLEFVPIWGRFAISGWIQNDFAVPNALSCFDFDICF